MSDKTSTQRSDRSVRSDRLDVEAPTQREHHDGGPHDQTELVSTLAQAKHKRQGSGGQTIEGQSQPDSSTHNGLRRSRLPPELRMLTYEHLVPMRIPVRTRTVYWEATRKYEDLLRPLPLDGSKTEHLIPFYQTMRAFSSDSICTHSRHEFWRAAIPRINWEIVCNEWDDASTAVDGIRNLEARYCGIVRHVTLVVMPEHRWHDPVGNELRFRQAFDQVQPVIEYLASTQPKRKAWRTLTVQLVTHQVGIHGGPESWDDDGGFAKSFHDACRVLCRRNAAEVKSWKTLCQQAAIEFSMVVLDRSFVVGRQIFRDPKLYGAVQSIYLLNTMREVDRRFIDPTRIACPCLARAQSYIRNVCVRQVDVTDFFDDLHMLSDELLEDTQFDMDSDEIDQTTQKAIVRQGIWDQLAEAAKYGSRIVLSWLRNYEMWFPAFYKSSIKLRYGKYLEDGIEDEGEEDGDDDDDDDSEEEGEDDSQDEGED